MNQYRIIDNVLSEDDLIKIEQNVLQAPIFKAFDTDTKLRWVLNINYVSN